MPNPDSELEVYKQRCEDLRFYGDMRFKQLTLWSVGIGFVVNALYGKEALSLTACQKGMWYVAAFLWTAVIWIMEVRSSVHGVRGAEFKRRFEEAGDKDLSNKNDNKYQNKWTLINATNAVAALYVVSCLWWTIQLACSWGFCSVSIWVPILAFVVLLAFTITEYWHLLTRAVESWKW